MAPREKTRDTITYRWIVPNLRQAFDSSKGSTKSPDIKSPQFGNENYQWNIVFNANCGYPGEETKPEHASIYLEAAPTAVEKGNSLGGKWAREGRFDASFDICDVGGKSSIVFLSYTKHSFSSKTSPWGWPAAAPRDTLYYKAEAVKDKDAFLVICTVMPSPATPVPRPPIVRTSFEFEKASMLSLTTPPTFDDILEERQFIKEKLTAAVRIFAQHGLDHHIAGQLTVRDPENPTRFWVNPFGLSFRVMTVSDLILVSKEGKVLGGGKPGRRIINLASFQIHSNIYSDQPNVNAICHSYTTYGKAFSTLVGRQLDITTIDSAAFHGSVAYPDYDDDAIFETSEGAHIASSLKNCKAAILPHRGILTIGNTIDSAVAWYIMLEKQCEVQLLADAAAAAGATEDDDGKAIKLKDDEVQFYARETGSERAGYFAAQPYFQTIEALQGTEYRK